ncbi:MAG TPA: hypothetical protein DCG53_05635 [Syntrophus sp. (in: bacteria)]|jgi:hypothetical protein|nr:hypothetical protein [Syntrophus sp. (in: bacteria)]
MEGLTMKKKIITIAGMLILTLGAGVIYSLPYVTIYRIIVALEASDKQQLAELVDFTQIRENMKGFVGTKLNAGPTDTKPDALGQIQKSLTSRVVAGAVENLITPEGLASFMRQNLEAMVAAQDGPNKIKPTAWLLFVTLVGHADLAYASPSEFIVAFKLSDVGQIRFVLRRNGVAWRLTNIEF